MVFSTFLHTMRVPRKFYGAECLTYGNSTHNLHDILSMWMDQTKLSNPYETKYIIPAMIIYKIGLLGWAIEDLICEIK